MLYPKNKIYWQFIAFIFGKSKSASPVGNIIFYRECTTWCSRSNNSSCKLNSKFILIFDIFPFAFMHSLSLKELLILYLLLDIAILSFTKPFGFYQWALYQWLMRRRCLPLIFMSSVISMILIVTTNFVCEYIFLYPGLLFLF